MIERNSKTITLSCGKLTTGVTIREWTGIFMLRNVQSPETYFQAAFRVQSPWKSGEDIIKHKCLCCKKVTISNTNYEVGHVMSEKNGGTHEINNLRPICFSCNHSMGSENMIDFVVKFGLFIG